MINLYEAIKSDQQYFRSLNCKGMLFTCYDCPQIELKQDYFSELNFIIYSLSGKRIFHQSGKTYAVTKGKCFFSRRGGFIAERDTGDSWCVILFLIPDNYLVQFIKEYRSNLPIKKYSLAATEQIMEIDLNDTTRSFFNSMVPYFEQSPSPPESLLELKFRELIFDIVINPNNGTLLTYLCAIADGAKQPLQDVMETSYVYDLTLTEFAKISHRSLATFKREFKDVFKTTPGKWLTQKKIQHAQMLVETSHKNISEIAYESGFKNTTHFCKVFRERVGISALQYRNKKLAHSVL